MQDKPKYNAVQLERLRRAGIEPQAGPSPEALAAFYRQRSEALKRERNYAIRQGQQATPVQPKAPISPPTGIGLVDYIISALRGET